MTDETKDLVPKTGQLVPSDTPGTIEELPDFIEKGNREGMEHLTAQDIQLPRINLAQQMSPELVQGDPKEVQGLRIGNMFNSLTGKIYGDGPLQFTILRMDPPRWVEFIPREQGGGVRDPNVPPGDPRTEFQPDGKPPIATKFYDFVVMLIPSREIIALSFKSTGLKVAKQLNGLIAMRNHAIYAGVYTISSKMTQNAKGRFAIFEVKNAGVIRDKDTHDFAKGQSYALRGKQLNIHTQDDPDAFDPNTIEASSTVHAPEGDVQGM